MSVGTSSAKPRFVVCPPQLARDEQQKEGGGTLDMQNYVQVRPFCYVVCTEIVIKYMYVSEKCLLHNPIQVQYTAIRAETIC